MRIQVTFNSRMLHSYLPMTRIISGQDNLEFPCVYTSTDKWGKLFLVGWHFGIVFDEMMDLNGTFHLWTMWIPGTNTPKCFVSKIKCIEQKSWTQSGTSNQAPHKTKQSMNNEFLRDRLGAFPRVFWQRARDRWTSQWIGLLSRKYRLMQANKKPICGIDGCSSRNGQHFS